MRHSCLCVLLLSVLAALTSCNKDKEDNTYPGLKKFSFSATDALIANPERGFYSGSGFSSAGDSPISVNVLMAGRREARTLYMLEFWLKDFFESDISEDFLTFIRANLAVFRQGGSKCILRFGYSDYIKDLSNPDPDGPFDTTEEQVLRHIAQLKPILQEYSDVIYVLQAGFIGCWGEWHYTTHFNQHAQTAEDLLPRKHVVDALLDALPADRQVEPIPLRLQRPISTRLKPALAATTTASLSTGLTREPSAAQASGIIGKRRPATPSWAERPADWATELSAPAATRA